MMNMQEVPEIITAVGQLPMEQMDWQDQMFLMAASAEFADKMKPLVIKYADRLPESSTFLFKMGGSKFPQ